MRYFAEHMQGQIAGRTIIVDEAGLLSVRQMHALCHLAERQKCRLLLVGDVKQHHSVEAGDYFKVDLDKEWRRTKGFVIYRPDSSFTDFSFLNCIDGPDQKEDVRQALRYAVYPQIVQFKNMEFAKKRCICCPYLGTELNASNSHVDHVAPSFDALSKNWLAENNLSLEAIELVANADNQYVRKLKNDAISASWETFHQKNATLRVISSLANLAHAKRKKMD